MKFEEVAHLYIGCKVRYTAVYKPELEPTYEVQVTAKLEHWNFGAITTRKNAKPILRRLDSMKEEERKECDKQGSTGWHTITKGEPVSVITPGTVGLAVVHRQSFETAYLLSQHFDLFGLIDSCEAIDAATLEPNPYA